MRGLCEIDSAPVTSEGRLRDLLAAEFNLVLRRFAGAARELDGALLINPYDLDETAGALAEALHMPVGEQRHRMRSMRAIVGERNAYRWIGDMLQDAVRLRAGANLGLAEETAEEVPA